MSSNCVLAELGERVAEDGPAAHDRLLQHVATLVADVAPGAAAALRDRSAPAVVRQRALAIASAVLLPTSVGVELVSLGADARPGAERSRPDRQSIPSAGAAA